MPTDPPAADIPRAATPLRLAFLGSAHFSLTSLMALLAAGHEVAAVYTQPPRPAGRGHREQRSPVHAYADSRGIDVRTPKSLRATDAQQAFADLGLDAAVVAAYGLILPKPILAAPRLGCLNVHASLLPRWRGAAPIQRAIIAGDAVTGVTIMQMDEGLDTGGMLLWERVPIGPQTTAAILHDELAALGATLLLPALDGVAAGTLMPTPQPAEGATYARKLDRDEGRLDWTRPAAELERIVRALNPAPGVWFEHAGERIKLLAAAVVDGSATPGTVAPGTVAPGTVLDDRMTIACGAAALRPVVLQRSGRLPSELDAFLRGYAIPPGTRLG